MNTTIATIKGVLGVGLLQTTEIMPEVGDGLDTIVKCITQIIICALTVWSIVKTNKKQK